MSFTNVAIQQNLVYLSDHLCNLSRVLIHLYQKGIVIQDEVDIINSKIQTSEKNAELFRMIMKKDVPLPKLLRIFTRTGNEHLALRLEKCIPAEIPSLSCLETLPELKTKWWPEPKQLPTAFCKRKIGDLLFVSELNSLLVQDQNNMTVINQTRRSTKLFGLGGIGKTATAKWYANHFDQSYNHIIWIDCGEGSLFKSFTKLANDLNIPDANELELEDLALKSFEKLSDLKCLFIFDNAECYFGDDGIQTVLPKKESNFHCLITSRNHNWRLEDGEDISFFEIDIFDSEESVEFFSKNMNQNIEHEDETKQLCDLLGNLPLALELAISAINNNQLQIGDYLSRFSTEMATNPSNSNDESLDNYETIVNAIMKVSLDEIVKNQVGKLAQNILSIFAYILPDGVETVFFEQITNSVSSKLKEAVELLTKYSFIMISEKIPSRSADKEACFKLSIHRLLQQVIRHNGKTTESESIREILNCENFLDYKLMPYKYANDSLKKEFGNIRAQLIDQFQLQNLLKSRRFAEALELSSLIHSEMNSSVSLYNYAVCLVKNEESLEVAEETLENLYSQIKMPVWGDEVRFEMGTLNITTEKPDKFIVAGKLFFLLCKLEKFEKVIKVFKEIDELISCFASEVRLRVTYMVRLLNLVFLPNYTLKADSDTISLEISKNPKDRKIIHINSCHFLEKTKFPSDLQELIITDIRVIDQRHFSPQSTVNTKQLLIPNNITRLEISCFKKSSSSLEISLTDIYSIEYIRLSHCYIVLDGNRLSPKELHLSFMKFLREKQNVSQVLVNEFVNFHQMYNLELDSGWSSSINSFNRKNSLLMLDMSESFSLKNVHLEDVKVVEWKDARWNIAALSLNSVSLEQGNIMAYKSLEISNASIDINCLPPNIEKIQLRQSSKVITSSLHPGCFDFKNLTELDLEDDNIGYLPYFRDHSTLQKLRLVGLYADRYPYSQAVVPESVRELYLSGNIREVKILATNVLNKVVFLDILNTIELKDPKTLFCTTPTTTTLATLEQLKQITSCYKTVLVLKAEDPIVIEPNISLVEERLMALIKIPFKRIVIGKFNLHKETPVKTINFFAGLDFAKVVDAIGDYYIFQEGVGIAIDEKQFREYSEF